MPRNFPGDPANVNPQMVFSKTASMGFIIFSGLRIDIFLALVPGEKSWSHPFTFYPVLQHYDNDFPDNSVLNCVIKLTYSSVHRPVQLLIYGIAPP